MTGDLREKIYDSLLTQWYQEQFQVIDEILYLGLAFYDWETQELIRRIEIQPKNVYWSSENGAELVCISTEVI